MPSIAPEGAAIRGEKYNNKYCKCIGFLPNKSNCFDINDRNYSYLGAPVSAQNCTNSGFMVHTADNPAAAVPGVQGQRSDAEAVAPTTPLVEDDGPSAPTAQVIPPAAQLAPHNIQSGGGEGGGAAPVASDDPSSAEAQQKPAAPVQAAIVPLKQNFSAGTQDCSSFTGTQLAQCNQSNEEIIASSKTAAISQGQINAMDAKKRAEILAKQAECRKNGGKNCEQPEESSNANTRGEIKSQNKCGQTVMLMLSKEAIEKGSQKTRSGVQGWLNGAGKERKRAIEDQYNCTADSGDLETYDSVNEMLALSTTLAASGAGAYAQAKTMQTAQEGGNVFKEGNKAMGWAQIATGGTQLATGTAQIIMGSSAGTIQKKHKEALENLQGVSSAGGEVQDDVTNSGRRLTQAGTAAAISNNDLDGKESNAKGEAMLAAATTQHEEIAAKAKQSKTRSYMQGMINLLGGATQTVTGYFNLKTAGIDVASQQYMPPIVAPESSGYLADGTPAPTAGPSSTTNEPIANPIESGSTDEEAPPMQPLPPLLGGPGNPGGLKDMPIAPSGNFVGSGTSSGAGGGGGGLSGLGGGDSGGGGGGKEDQDSITSGNVKFEGTGGGGPGGGFASTGGNSARRVSDTGMDMSALNQMLAGFLPKKEDDKAQNNILNFQGGQGPRGPGSAHDDGSILGPNSTSLFKRAATVYTSSYKVGRVR